MSTTVPTKSIYLAGPISGCDDAQANGWRDHVVVSLGDHYGFRNPMDRDYRHLNMDHEACKSGAREVTDADEADIAFCDVLLANMLYPSTGTAMEIHHAALLGKPVISIVPRSARLSPWVARYSDEIFYTLDEALRFLLNASH